MDQPKIASTSPTVIELEPGTYWWCHCGLSKDQPFCDGSHSGTSFGPMKVDVDAKKKVALCNCKRTGASPFCDGAHARLP